MSEQPESDQTATDVPGEEKASKAFSAVSLEDEDVEGGHGENGGHDTGIAGVVLENTEIQEVPTQPVTAALLRLKLATESRYRCTKQSLSERFGKGTRTIDSQLDERITTLRDTQKKYVDILLVVRKLSMQLKAAMETQQCLGDMFAEYAVHTPEFVEVLTRNSDIQRQVSRNGELLLAIMMTFERNLETVSRKAIEDTLVKVKEYESSRLEYDSFRTNLEQLQANKVQNPGSPADAAKAAAKLQKAEADFEVQRARYDKMRNELSIKLGLLDENKTKVMKTQLVLFHNACCAYYTADVKALSECMQKFHIKPLPTERQGSVVKESAKFDFMAVTEGTSTSPSESTAKSPLY